MPVDYRAWSAKQIVARNCNDADVKMLAPSDTDRFEAPWNRSFCIAVLALSLVGSGTLSFSGGRAALGPRSTLLSFYLAVILKERCTEFTEGVVQ